MARIVSCSASLIDSFADGWECVLTPSKAIASPEDFTGTENWLPASVPGTAASALRAAGAWNGVPPLELDQQDVWYRVRFTGGGEETLHFEGLATIADVWLNGVYLFRSENMFLPHDAAVRTETMNELHICFRSLTTWLQDQRGRARWRTRLVVPPSLRFARTTLLGRMPGWCPRVHPVGPWRAVQRKRRLAPFNVSRVELRTLVLGEDGRLELNVILDVDPTSGIDAVIEVGGHAARLDRVEYQKLSGAVVIPDVMLWWPHTHGAPHLYKTTLRLGAVVCHLGDIGFRHISVDRGEDGCCFGIQVNGQEIFCRGACWTTPDLVALPGDAASYRPWLEAMRDAGMNMVRIGGTMLYESDDFFRLCDELGLLVWQDVMLANFDYPATPGFLASLSAEIENLLDRTQSNACLAVLCGGSEVLQQATMSGLPTDRIDDTLYRNFIPEIVRRLRPDLPYLINSPSGGDLPFLPDAGVTHYYGVGAYLRPLDDARRATVRFASECLAIANVPCDRTVASLHATTTTDPCWKQAVPRDLGTSWDFEDVRDHYLELLFAIDARRLRSEDFARYLDLSRAVSCILVEQVFGEWRRVGSTCRGGLVWHLQDVALGAGWGVIDAAGRRKPAWHALQRALRSRQLIITDEGLNGLAFHVLNERDTPLRGVLRIACLRSDAIPMRTAERAFQIEPRGAKRIDSADLLPSFFDITYAYRFSPPAHEVTIATLHDASDDTVIADAYHFPARGILPSRDLGMDVAVERQDGTWWLRLRSQCFAQFVHIEDATLTAREDWFHLPPGRERRVALHTTAGATALPEGEIHALNSKHVMRYAGRP
jgi:beta-mannosidase